MKISLVVPLFNEEQTVRVLLRTQWAHFDCEKCVIIFTIVLGPQFLKSPVPDFSFLNLKLILYVRIFYSRTKIKTT